MFSKKTTKSKAVLLTGNQKSSPENLSSEKSTFEKIKLEKIKMEKNIQPCFISANLSMKGTLKGEADVQLDGTIEGEMQVGALTIGKTGVFIGKLKAENVYISGKCEGEIVANMVALKSSAKVKGDIFYESITIDMGASIEGGLNQQTKMIENDTSKTARISNSKEVQGMIVE